MPHRLAATFWEVCCLKCPNESGYLDSCHFYKSLGLGSLGEGGGGTRDTGLVTVDNLFENPARYIPTYIHIDTYIHT